MKQVKRLFTSALILFPLVSFADEPENSAFNKNQNSQPLAMNQTNRSAATVAGGQQSTLLDSGEILTISKTSDGRPMASHFSTKPADPQTLVKQIVTILKSTNANQAIINFAETRLIRHPFLKKSQFRMPVTGEDSKMYEFTYSSDIETNLYILNYQYIGIDKS